MARAHLDREPSQASGHRDVSLDQMAILPCVRPQIVGATYQIRPREPNNPCWGMPEGMSWVEGSELIAVATCMPLEDGDQDGCEDGDEDDNPIDLICLGAG